MKLQAVVVHHSPEHDEDIPVQDPVLLVLWPVLLADATFAEKMPLVQVNELSEVRPAAVQAQTYVQGQWTLPGLAA